jgi:hypothetical protein
MPRFQSDTFASQDLIDGTGEVQPDASLFREHGTSSSGQAVETPSAFSRLLDPAARQEALVLEANQNRIQRSDAEGKTPAGTALDELGQVVAVAGTGFQQGKDQEFGAALLQFSAEYSVHASIYGIEV